MVSRYPQLAALTALAVFLALRGLVSGAPAAASAAPAPVPLRIGRWQGRVLEVDGRAVEILETDDVALLEYTSEAAQPPVWVAQVAGFGNRAAFHPPELCYVGSHFEVLEREAITITVHGQPRRVMRLVVGKGGRTYEAWYWFTANGRMTPSYYEQQMWLLADAVFRKPLSGTLMRISTALDDSAAARRRLLDFINALEGPSGATSTLQMARHGV